jgi:NADH dehydrogenase [ubiquinone] 1 alpha subcomplex assembly factor 5
MNRAGFTLLTVDIEDLSVSYPSIWELMEDLRDMGESGAVLGRRPFIKRDVLIAGDAIYRGEFFKRHVGPETWRKMLMAGSAGVELHGNEDGSVPATFQVIYLVSCWSQELQSR